MSDKSADIVAMFDTVSLGAPQNAVGFVMWRVMHRYVRSVDQNLRPLDLTHLQFTVLALIAWLARTGESATQVELARFGDIHPMQVSNVLKALEHKAMIERTQSPDNSLAKCVTITTSGLTALRSAIPFVMEVQRKLFGSEGLPGGNLLETLRQIDAAR